MAKPHTRKTAHDGALRRLRTSFPTPENWTARATASRETDMDLLCRWLAPNRCMPSPTPPESAKAFITTGVTPDLVALLLPPQAPHASDSNVENTDSAYTWRFSKTILMKKKRLTDQNDT